MFFRNLFGARLKRTNHGRVNVDQGIDPDEVFLDSHNLPGFDTDQFEGRIEKPISKKVIYTLGIGFTLIIFIFIGKVWNLQISDGQGYFDRSIRNSLRHSVIFADRGTIYDKFGVPLAWSESQDSETDFSTRKYTENPGFYNLLGYVSYPKKDSAGFYFDEETNGVVGIESIYNDYLKGENGLQILETDALSKVVSQSTTRPPQNGKVLYLTIDSELQTVLYDNLVHIINDYGFSGGGAVIMDVFTGEIVSMVSYPEYDSNILTTGEDNDAIANFINDPNNPFLNRVTQGLYTPGSIVKPFIALAALEEDVINSTDEILSTGELLLPNPYNPDKPTIFTDWKAHGYVNVFDALAVSSNIYFYEIGGGYKDIEGLGISRIEEYMRQFGFGESVNLQGFSNPDGTIPNPEWKRKIFDDDWRIGDTYFTAIGQYGFQVTPIQIVRAVGAIANGGILIEPKIVADATSATNIKRQIDASDKNFNIIKQGMRQAVVSGTAKGLSYPDFEIAAKTGTAELGVSKARVNSWVTGFFPYQNPRYAFVAVLEKGDRNNFIGGVAVMRGFFDWLKAEKPEYIN
jgi:penicillin-binding protein 2